MKNGKLRPRFEMLLDLIRVGIETRRYEMLFKQAE